MSTLHLEKKKKKRKQFRARLIFFFLNKFIIKRRKKYRMKKYFIYLIYNRPIFIPNLIDQSSICYTYQYDILYHVNTRLTINIRDH